MASTVDDIARTAARSTERATIEGTSRSLVSKFATSLSKAFGRRAAGMVAARAEGKAAFAEAEASATLTSMADDAERTASTMANRAPAAENAADDAAIAARRAAGESQAEAQATVLKSKYGWAAAKTVAGISVASWCIYLIVLKEATDGATIKITNISAVAGGKLQVSFTVDSVPSGSLKSSFQICKNDSLNFYGCTGIDCTIPSLDVGVVDAVVNDNTVIIVPSPSVTLQGASSPVASAPVAADWGYATVHTCLGNQFAASVGGAAAAIGQATLDIIDPVLGPGGILPTVVPQVIGLGKNAFCDLIPFMCSTNTLWGALGFILFIVFCVVVYYVLKSMSSGKGSGNGSS